MQSFPAELRILVTVATLAGASDSLESINTTILMDRCLVACKANNSLYILEKDSVAAPSPPDIVAPASANWPGRWALYAPGGGGSGPAPALTRTLYVSVAGNDTTGDGSFSKPFLTLDRACTLIRSFGNASTLLRYVVNVGAGRFINQAVTMSEWTYFVGQSKEATRIAFTSIVLGPEWTPAGDHRAGFQNMSISGGITIDFNTTSSNEGKVRFDDVVMNDQWHFIAFSAINQCLMESCFLFGGYTQVGMNMILQNTLSLGDVSMTSVNDGRNLPTLCTFAASALNTLQLHWTLSTGSNPVTANFIGTGQTGALTLDGVQATIDPTSSPIAFPGGVTLIAGAPDPRKILTGSRGGNAALASVCSQLAASGGYVDNTTP